MCVRSVIYCILCTRKPEKVERGPPPVTVISPTTKLIRTEITSPCASCVVTEEVLRKYDR